jgi:toxin-antitoxin system PIN domain toxin
MIVLDVNVVLALHRQDHPHHPIVRPWFDGVAELRQDFAVPDGVWASVVRLATNRRIFTVPSGLDDVFAFMRAVRDQPSYAALAPAERHLAIFEEVCRGSDATGDLAADAYLAAVTIEVGGELVSLDRDFARFVDLRWRRPG